jgi:hypothetical protein
MDVFGEHAASTCKLQVCRRSLLARRPAACAVVGEIQGGWLTTAMQNRTLLKVPPIALITSDANPSS